MNDNQCTSNDGMNDPVHGDCLELEIVCFLVTRSASTLHFPDVACCLPEVCVRYYSHLNGISSSHCFYCFLCCLRLKTVCAEAHCIWSPCVLALNVRWGLHVMESTPPHSPPLSLDSSFWFCLVLCPHINSPLRLTNVHDCCSRKYWTCTAYHRQCRWGTDSGGNQSMGLCSHRARPDGALHPQSLSPDSLRNRPCFPHWRRTTRLWTTDSNLEPASRRSCRTSVALSSCTSSTVSSARIWSNNNIEFQKRTTLSFHSEHVFIFGESDHDTCTKSQFLRGSSVLDKVFSQLIAVYAGANSNRDASHSCTGI